MLWFELVGRDGVRRCPAASGRGQDQGAVTECSRSLPKIHVNLNKPHICVIPTPFGAVILMVSFQGRGSVCAACPKSTSQALAVNLICCCYRMHIGSSCHCVKAPAQNTLRTPKAATLCRGCHIHPAVIELSSSVEPPPSLCPVEHALFLHLFLGSCFLSPSRLHQTSWTFSVQSTVTCSADTRGASACSEPDFWML